MFRVRLRPGGALRLSDPTTPSRKPLVDARFVRINLEHPTVPASLRDRGLGIAGEVVASMWEVFTKSSA